MARSAITLRRPLFPNLACVKSEVKETRMGMTLLAMSALLSPLQQMAGEFGRALRTRKTPARNLAQAGRPGLPRNFSPVAAPAGGLERPPRPLRVRRVAEPHRPAASAGRMVISGRIADVCAELDRLAGLEAAGPPPRHQ